MGYINYSKLEYELGELKELREKLFVEFLKDSGYTDLEARKDIRKGCHEVLDDCDMNDMYGEYVRLSSDDQTDIYIVDAEIMLLEDILSDAYARVKSLGMESLEDLIEMERLENEELTEDDFSDPSEWEEYSGQ